MSGPPLSSSSKVKDMKKAYGISSSTKTKTKTSTSTKAHTSSSLSSAEKTSIANNNLISPQKLRQPPPGADKKASTGSSRRSDVEASSSHSKRKSIPSEGTNSTKPSSKSKILAVSKANYVEKYGNAASSDPTPGTAVPSKKYGKDGSKEASSHRQKISNSDHDSPYKQNPSTKNVPNTKSKSTVSAAAPLLITSQQPPSAYYESEPTDDYNNDEFEEDYESDFEQADSTEAEDEVGSEPTKGDNDKSSSVQEFEKLEKMIEVEERKESQPSIANNTIAETNNEGSEAGSDSEDNDSDDEGSPTEPMPTKQNAFPTTTGFSISHSAQMSDLDNKAKRLSSGSKVNILSTGSNKAESETQKQRRKNRGKIIQSMIKLDRVEHEIYHLSPYPYDRFMSIFSGADRFQVSTQTDYDRSEESVQTETVPQNSKWTQKPPTWSTTSSSCDIRIVRQEALGVGSDEILTDDLTPDQKIDKQFYFLKNWEPLSKFIIRASRKVLYVLEQDNRVKLPSNSGKKGSLETIKMNRGLSVLSKLDMHTLAGDGEFVACANGLPHQVLLEEVEKRVTNGNKKNSKNLISVWSLKEPSMPLYFLRVWGHVSALKVHMIGRLITSGNSDGSINVWDLEESISYHTQYQEQIIRTPSVNTSCMANIQNGPVIGIEMFSEAKNTFTIVSADREGTLIIWSCLRSPKESHGGESTVSEQVSAWSTIHVEVRHEVKLGEVTPDPLMLTCFSAFLDTEASTTGFYLGTFNGYGAKGKIIFADKSEEGGRLGKVSATLEKYQERMDFNPKITCVDVSTTLNILAMGCGDGRCRLFELSRKKLVLSLGGKEEPISLKWSKRRVSVLYVALKDSLLIWDLLSSDMNPWKTIHLKDIKDFVLYSPPQKEYLVIITGTDLIISTPAEEVKPLSNRDFARVQSYFSLLC